MEYLGIPLPAWVIGFLILGLALGYLFPDDPAIRALHLSGTYFPKTVVTLAAFLIFNLLASATAKLVLLHRDRAGRLFGLIVGIYVAMGTVSLIYVALLIPFLTGLPMSQSEGATPGLAAWLAQVFGTLSSVLSKQPLLQALAGAVAVGYLSATVRPLRPVAHGLIAAGDAILRVFKGLLWYYPIMIGTLAIGIPMKFGSAGMALYGQTVLWVGAVTLGWALAMVVLARLATRRSLRQLLSYFGTVWPTGFGTGGSYDTLAVNIVSAEQDLGLRKKVAEVAIVFGTVLNKNCATMAVLLVTVTVSRMLEIPLSVMELVVLIPPVMILGLESPGVPGGAGFFMAPIVGALLGAPDLNLFVTTFVTVYSGLIPMLTTAGNTTTDGIVGALLNDRFQRYLGL